MSKGWESKAIEEQQAQAARQPPPRDSAGSGNQAGDAARRREIQALSLQRERILSERTSSPHRRTALEGALATIEEKLAELGWTLHL